MFSILNHFWNSFDLWKHVLTQLVLCISVPCLFHIWSVSQELQVFPLLSVLLLSILVSIKYLVLHLSWHRSSSFCWILYQVYTLVLKCELSLHSGHLINTQNVFKILLLSIKNLNFECNQQVNKTKMPFRWVFWGFSPNKLQWCTYYLIVKAIGSS